MPVKHPTNNICPICAVEPDTVRHFFVDCPLKFVFWQQAFSTTFTTSSLSSDNIWDLLHLHITDGNRPWSTHLSHIGLILQTIWSMHWRSVFHNLPWHPHIASQFYQNLLSRHPFVSSRQNTQNQFGAQLPQ
ncbi:hypothetical protein INT45_008860 [Circinella minor]|uniref:Reverse transcriptase zinc-binding domain-containing protein n=1 Tax=Circinella minor TaxID=1195481 RepID=A0A8H7RS92_9FUNG|nr:hypothetical protein INT45_008860 [Circinella minor]